MSEVLKGVEPIHGRRGEVRRDAEPRIRGSHRSSCQQATCPQLGRLWHHQRETRTALAIYQWLSEQSCQVSANNKECVTSLATNSIERTVQIQCLEALIITASDEQCPDHEPR